MNHKEIIEEYEVLHEASEFEKAYQLLLPLETSNDSEVLWRLAQAVHDVFYDKPTTEITKKGISDAMQFISRSLALNDDCYGAHLTAAALIDLHYKNISVKARVAQSLNARGHIKRAIELKPSDPRAPYMLGWWYYAVADLPWAVKKLSKIIFSTMLDASFEQSLAQFEAVLEKKNAKEFKNYTLSIVMAGKCNIKLNNPKTAIQYFRRALQEPIKTTIDNEAHAEAQQLLNDYM